MEGGVSRLHNLLLKACPEIGRLLRNLKGNRDGPL
jgi:hypothetical protein